MSFHDEMLAVVDEVRNILGPDDLDWTRHQLTVRTRTWSGGAKGLGTTSDSDLVLPQKFRVDRISAAEVASSGGQYEMGDVKVLHITPADATHSVGFTVDQLKPPITTDAVERIYLLVGPHGGEYGLVELQSFKNISWALILRRRTTTP